MTILFLARRFYPHIGGVEKHVLEIGKRMVKDGHRVVVVTQSLGKDKSIQGIEIVRLPSTFSKLQIWKWFWQNKDLARSADVIHAHDVYFWYFPLRFLFPLKKSFVTFHGYESYPIRKGAILIRKISEKLSNGNIVVGDFIKKWYGTKPNFVIYGAVDIPKNIVNPKNKESAVFMGRLDEHTGILDYARAIDLIREEYSNFEFSILGDGEYKSKLQKYNPLGFINNSVKFLEERNYAFVSRYLAILEALSYRRLVFALYDNPVKEDYLKMTPFAKYIVVENTPEKIREKLEYFLNNPKEEKKLKDKGFDWVKNQTWESMVDTYLKLWKGK